MNLIEMSAPPAEAYPVRALADHLHLGTGFADDGHADALLEAYLRAALATVEGRTGKILLERTYAWEISRWVSGDAQGLPVAPVSAVTALVLVAADGSETVVAPGSYRLRPDAQRPEVTASVLPSIPYHGSARIEFTAGFGAVWEDSPADLRQAVLMLAAHYFENRAAAGKGPRELPFGVSALIDRFQPVRLLGDRL